MKTARFFAVFAAGLLLAACSDSLVTSDIPSVKITNVTTASDHIVVSIDGSGYDETACLVLSGSDAVPAAEEVFAQGVSYPAGRAACINGLEPGTSYRIFAAGRALDVKYSEVVSYEAITGNGGEDFRFNTNFVNYCTVGYHSIVPSRDNAKYAILGFYGSLDEVLTSHGVNSVYDLAVGQQYSITDDAIYTGMTPSEIPDNPESINWAFRLLNPDSYITIVAWYIDDNYLPVSTPYYEEIKTPAVPERSPLEIRLNSYELGDDTITLAYDSNQGANNTSGYLLRPLYFETWNGLVAYKADEFEGLSDREIALKILYRNRMNGKEAGRNYNLTGEALEFAYNSLCYPKCEPGEEYIIPVFGTWRWNLTTTPHILRFKVPGSYNPQFSAGSPAASLCSPPQDIDIKSKTEPLFLTQL